MRLLNTATLRMQDFTMSAIPPYAILSHTWSVEEVTFQERFAPTKIAKKGWSKIAKTCQLAHRSGLAYAWVDTICIDKSSSAELSEAINSMYQWYSEAALCIIFLEDLPTSSSLDKDLPRCRWFTRGWTLQELLAPKNPLKVKFYDKAWCFRGSKMDFVGILSARTGIPASILSGRTELTDCSVAERLSWAALRETTRPEDAAYCLFGLFGVNMPLLYGEGMKAFRRLQEEIIKINNDLTIFAWDAQQPYDRTTFKLFAETPTAFVTNSRIKPFGDDCEDFSLTNKGLLVSGEAPLREVSIVKPNTNYQISLYALFVGFSTKYVEKPDGGIYLRKIGPKLFVRDLSLPLAGFLDPNFDQLRVLDDMTNYYILTDPKPNISPLSFRNCALHIPANTRFELEDAVPETLWDVTDRVFLKPKPYIWVRYPMVMALEFRAIFLQENMELVVLCQYKEGDLFPSCKVFWRGSFPREEIAIFQHRRNRRESIYWSQLELDAPRILELNNKVERSVGRKTVLISAYFDKGIIDSISGSVEVFSLKFDVSIHDPADSELSKLE